ncbi:methyltransferase dimerization domain-containing protein [Methanolobus vulcani]|uniref:SAM-dependent methyltransferase n=1 Tax=Methanolobus vulcani TaxID=38026 RepID=A0A7Z8KM81_9EURY|nr:methyltransferase dimerization domain-containing protein [Methanolobus vulcani]TQD24389.1 SAM-dependent methyltransferase [Methanolobus vulcani]
MNSAKELMKRPEVCSDELIKFIDDSMNGFRKYKILTTAVKLQLFEYTKDPVSSEELAAKMGCNPEMVPLLCDVLCECGLLVLNGEKYSNTGLTNTYLVSDSPFSQLNYLRDMERSIAMWEKLDEIITNGPVIVDKQSFFGDGIIHSMAENAKCGMLQEVVETVTEDIDFDSSRKMIDLGGGHGLYSIALTGQNENLKAFVFDLPQVTEHTKKYAEKYGTDQVDVIPGNFFTDDIGSEYDIVFSSLNPGGKVPDLIPKIVSALKTGGVFVNRQVPGEDANAMEALNWNMWTFDDTKKSSALYSFENSVSLEEYIDILKTNGFDVFKELDLTDGSRIIFSRKV